MRPGEPLPANLRAEFESSLGADLSRVRIFHDVDAERSAARMNARAYTIGADIFFARGEYRPESPEGRKLIGHELAHTIQQSGGNRNGGASISESDAELEADEASESVTHAHQATDIGAVPAGAVQRNGQDHSDESYSEFVQRVFDTAIARLERNRTALAEWRNYILEMQLGQLQTQLMSGNLNEYAVAASQRIGGSEIFESLIGTDRPSQRAWDESRLAPDAGYREKVGGYVGMVFAGVQGEWSDTSIGTRLQLEMGEIQPEDLPLSRFYRPKAGYEFYAPVVRNWENLGGCQRCHDLNFARQRTIEHYGEALPDIQFPEYVNTGPSPLQPFLQSAEITQDDARALAEFMGVNNVSPTTAATLRPWRPSQAVPATPPAPRPPTAAATATDQPAADLPDIPLPANVERPIPRTDLCGPLPAADNMPDPLDLAPHWGPNSAIAARYIRRVGAVLQPLGPRGYRILPRRTFDQLWSAGPRDMGKVRDEILANLDSRRDDYQKLQTKIRNHEVPYEELCPVVDEILPSTNESVRTLVRFEISVNRALESFLDTLFAIIGVALLFLAVLLPPLAIAVAGVGLAVVGVATGARDYRRGTQAGLGVGTGVHPRQMEEDAESLRKWGMFGMIASALDFIGSIRYLRALRQARTVGAVTGLHPHPTPHAPEGSVHPTRPAGHAPDIPEGSVRPTRAGEASPATRGSTHSDLAADELADELDFVARAERRAISDGPYVEEVLHPNGHRWRRNRDGRWCRFSDPFCVIGNPAAPGGVPARRAVEEAIEDLPARSITDIRDELRSLRSAQEAGTLTPTQATRLAEVQDELSRSYRVLPNEDQADLERRLFPQRAGESAGDYRTRMRNLEDEVMDAATRPGGDIRIHEALNRLLTELDENVARAADVAGELTRVRATRDAVDARLTAQRRAMHRGQTLEGRQVSTRQRDALDARVRELEQDLRQLTTRGAARSKVYRYEDMGTLEPCFVPSTLVSTPFGPRPIAELAPGSQVFSWHNDSVTACKVLEIHRGATNVLVEIQTGGEVIQATRSHPFWSEDRSEWVPAAALREGERLRSVQGIIAVDSIQTRDAYSETVNLAIQKSHNYFVGGAGVLVHNNGPRASGFDNPARYNTRIYLVEELGTDGVWRPIYVGKTRQGVTGDVGMRFDQHLNTKPRWRRLYDAPGGPRIRSRMVESGHWNALETAVWEEHSIRRFGGRAAEGGILENIETPLTRESFERGTRRGLFLGC